MAKCLTIFLCLTTVELIFSLYKSIQNNILLITHSLFFPFFKIKLYTQHEKNCNKIFQFFLGFCIINFITKKNFFPQHNFQFCKFFHETENLLSGFVSPFFLLQNGNDFSGWCKNKKESCFPVLFREESFLLVKIWGREISGDGEFLLSAWNVGYLFYLKRSF